MRFTPFSLGFTTLSLLWRACVHVAIPQFRDVFWFSFTPDSSASKWLWAKPLFLYIAIWIGVWFYEAEQQLLRLLWLWLWLWLGVLALGASQTEALLCIQGSCGWRHPRDSCWWVETIRGRYIPGENSTTKVVVNVWSALCNGYTSYIGKLNQWTRVRLLDEPREDQERRLTFALFSSLSESLL